MNEQYLGSDFDDFLADEGLLKEAEAIVMDKLLFPIHPGEMLLEDFMKPLGLMPYRLAKDIGVATIRINQIVKGQRSISVDTAMRLAQYFGTSPAVWPRLQIRYDLEAAQDKLGERIKREVKALHQPMANSSD